MTALRIEFAQQGATIFVDEYLFATLFIDGRQIETIIATTAQVKDWQRQAKAELEAVFQTT